MATYNKTYTFSNGTTADGGQVDTEITALGQSVNNIINAQIDSSAAIAISKTTLGTYTAPTSMAFTDVMKAVTTAPTQGNGTFSAYYSQIGKLVFFGVQWTFGSTSTAGSGAYLLYLPVANTTVAVANAIHVDSDTGNAYSYTLRADVQVPAQFVRYYLNGSTTTQLSHNSPITWATGDLLYVSGFYQVA